jgi:hypothetical protein
LVDDADAAAQRTTLGLGTSATRNVGTTSSDVASGEKSMPSGGSAGGALLQKLSGTDYDTGWVAAPSISGQTHQITGFGWAAAGNPQIAYDVFIPIGNTAVAQGALTASSTQEFFLDASPFVHRFIRDTATYQNFRVSAIIGTANANAKLGLQYATTFTGTYNFAESGTTTIGASEGVVLSATGHATTGWRTLVAGAKADGLYWRLVTVSGAATTAPAWGRVTVEYK